MHTLARIKKSKLTESEIIRVATRMFLEDGYSSTSIKAICNELSISTGNLTFYFHTKEHLLKTLVEMCCNFQWKMMKNVAEDSLSKAMALCLELAAMAAVCEDNEIAKNFYILAYTSPLSLNVIRKSDAKRAKEVFSQFCPTYTDEDFLAAEILVSGIEYSTLMTTDASLFLEKRIEGALDAILAIYNVPVELRKTIIHKVLSYDYHEIGKKMLREFKDYVQEVNEQNYQMLLNEL